MTERVSDIEARVARLPAEVSPPGDLWPAIEAQLVPRSAVGEVIGVELRRDIEPPEHLWTAIAAEIDTAPVPSGAIARWTAGLAAAAVVGLAVLQLHWTGRDAVPAGQAASLADVWWLAPETPVAAGSGSPVIAAALAQARATFRTTILAVRSERIALEATLAQRPDDAATRAMWRYTYRTELRLIDEGERVITDLTVRYES